MSGNETVWLASPLDESLGRCDICGCRLQHGESPKASVWMTPWQSCGGTCVTCMAHAGDPECIEALEDWIKMTRASAE